MNWRKNINIALILMVAVLLFQLIFISASKVDWFAAPFFALLYFAITLILGTLQKLFSNSSTLN